MNSAALLLEWLRGWHRGYKFAVLLLAAWSPFLFPESPILTGVIMALTTTLFFVVTGPRTESATRNPRQLAKRTMPHLSRMLLLIVAAPLGSCMTMPGPNAPVVFDGHNFWYVAPDRERIHLTQAFDDGSKTYLQFDDTTAERVDVRDLKSGHAVIYTVDQRYVIVPGVYGALAVTVGRESATVVNQAMPSIGSPGTVEGESGAEEKSPIAAKWQPTSTVMAPAITPLPDVLRRSDAAQDAGTRGIQAVPDGVTDPVQTLHTSVRIAALKHELSMLEENVRRLSAELEAAHLQGFGENLDLRSMVGLPRVVMRFDNNSFEARMDHRLRGAMGERHALHTAFSCTVIPMRLWPPRPARNSRYAGRSRFDDC